MKPRNADITVIEMDGSCELFRMEELQNRLFGAFVAVGRSDCASLAEDIALATERALRDCDRPNLTFGRGELDAAIVRLLENAGYPQAAQVYMRRGVSSVITIDTGAKAEIALLLRKHLSCSEVRFNHIVDAVMQSMQKAEISAATPTLLLEMGRHFEREYREAPLQLPLPQMPSFDRESLLPLLSAETARLVGRGILRVAGIHTLFPSLRFYCLLNDFAAEKNYLPPVTELEIIPDLRQIGRMIDEMRVVINRALDLPEPLPCLLTLPDLPEFVGHYFEQERSGIAPVAGELADVIASEIGCTLYKLSY